MFSNLIILHGIAYEIQIMCHQDQLGFKKMLGSPLTLRYSIKWEFDANPFTFISVTFIYSIAMLAFWMRCSELQSFFYVDGGGVDFNYYNSLWTVIVTMTTVGFGEFSPDTGNGRFISIIWAFLGIFLTSLLVISFHK